MEYVLGKNPPLRYPGEIAVHAADYIDLAKLPTPPRTLPSIGRGIAYEMFLNDGAPDCTIAAVGHMEQTHEARTGDPIDITDDEIFAFFDRTGKEQNLPNTDGRYMEGVLGSLKTTGAVLGGSNRKILGYAHVDWRNLELYRAVTWLFAGTYNGYALPLRAQSQVGKVWKIVGDHGEDEPGSWGGHAVFKTVPGTAITWSQRQSMTWAWHLRYGDESYGVLTEDWVENTKAPNGFARDELIRDLSQL